MQMPKRKATPTGAKRHMGRKSVKSSNRIRAARAGAAEMVVPGRRAKAQATRAIDDTNEEVYGVLLSERRRKGDSHPVVPEAKTKTTQSGEPKKTPRTGSAKRRRS